MFKTLLISTIKNNLMLRILTFILFAIPSIANSTNQIVMSGSLTLGTSRSSLSSQLSSCEGSLTTGEICLWFAQGDIISLYDPTTSIDYAVTIPNSNQYAAWYAVKPYPIAPNGVEIPSDINFYNGQYFEVDFGDTTAIPNANKMRRYYDSTPKADSNNLKDYLGRYQGYRDFENCSVRFLTTAIDSPYPIYSTQNQNTSTFLTVTNPTFNANTTNQYQTTPRTTTGADSSYRRLFCSPPTETGLSCEIKVDVNHRIVSSTNTSPELTITQTHTLNQCTDLSDSLYRAGTIARNFLIGTNDPLLFNDVLLLHGTQIQYSDANPITLADDSAIGDLLYTQLNDGTPPNATDTDGDGVPDETDAFPNDPTEQSDSDGDGVGDNSDAFPNDPTETLDSDGDGTGDNSDSAPNDPNIGGSGGGGTGGGGDGTGDEPVDNGVASTSNSCDVAPTCSGDVIACAALIQSWENACLNHDDSVIPVHSDIVDNYEVTASTFSGRVSNSNIVSSFSNISNMIGASSNTCPHIIIDLQNQLGVTIDSDVHCTVFNVIKPIISTVMLVIYSFIGFRILASA